MKYDTIHAIYDEINATVFNGVLEKPVIHASRCNDMWAAYIGEYGRESKIIVNFRNNPGIPFMRDILFHEMIHQYIEEISMEVEVELHAGIFWYYYRKFNTGNFNLANTF